VVYISVVDAVFFKSYACAHVPPYTHTPTRIRSSKRTEYDRGGIPAVCVHDLAKRLEMHTIPDNPGYTLY